MKKLFGVIREQKNRLEVFFAEYPQTKRLIILLVIALAVPLTVFAALTVQDLRQRASEAGAITVIDPTTNAAITTTDNPNVALKITLPVDWVVNPAQSMKRDTNDNGLVKKAYAAFNASTCLDISVNNGNPVSPGQSYPATVRIRNDGDTNWTWDNPNPYRLGAEDPQDNTVWSLARVDLPTSPILPGETATFRFTAWAPETPGAHSFNWQMVQEGVEWFGSRCYLQVVVNAPPSVPTAVPQIQQQSEPSATPIPEQEQINQPTQIPTQTPLQEPTGTSPIHVLTSISIQNVGSQEEPTTYTDNLQQRLQNSPWSLTPLKEGEQQADRVIRITLSDGTTEVQLQKSILLKESMGIQKRTVGTNQNIPTLTDELLHALNPNNTAFTALSKDQQLTSLTTLAKERKDKLLQELRTNPQAFLDHATLAKERSKFPQEIQSSIESEEDIEGDLVVMHMDNLKEKKAEYIYGLQTEGKLYNVYFVENDQYNPDQKIRARLKGIGIDNNIALTRNETNFQVLSYTEPQYVERSYNVAIMKIEGAIELLPSDEELRKMFITDKNSIKNYYQKTSFEKTVFNFDILGTFDISTEGFDCSAEGVRRMSQNVHDVLSNRGIDVSKYQAIQTFVPASQVPQDCIFQASGISDGGSSSPYSYVFGTSQLLSAGFQDIKDIAAHELGHTLGFSHSNTLKCLRRDFTSNPSTLVRDRKECENVGYGDNTDVMGASPYYAEVLSSSKLTRSWLDDKSDVWYVKENGRYTIAPLGSNSSGKKALYISQTRDPNPNGNNMKTTLNIYRLEYRARIGLDGILPTLYSQGVSLYDTGRSFGKNDIPNFSPGGRLVSLDNLDKGILKDGESFVDTINNIKITQISHDQNGVTVDINFDSDSTVNALRHISGNNTPEESNTQFQLFILCFKEKANTSSCPDKNAVDFNKDGKVDEQDYRVFLQSL